MAGEANFSTIVACTSNLYKYRFSELYSDVINVRLCSSSEFLQNSHGLLFAWQTMRSSYPTISVDPNLETDSGQTLWVLLKSISLWPRQRVYFTLPSGVHNSR